MIFTRYKKILSSFMLFVSVVVFFLAPIAVQDRGIAEVRYASAQGYGVESTGCAVFSVAGPAKNSMIECVAYLTYWVVFVPMSFIAYLGGTFLDFFMSFSLSDTSYRHPFVEQGWKMVRDISNIFFILVLLFVALAGMFNSAPDFKKTLPRIIIAALLINFSLFFTRVLIDVSNITARVFYNSIEVVTTDSTEGANVFGTKSVSTAIISNINPQRVIGTADNVKAGGVVGNGSTIQSNDRAGYFSLVALIAAVVCGVIAYVFFSVGTVFLGRVVGLYFAMIFAPFALMSTTLPALGNLEFVGWG